MGLLDDNPASDDLLGFKNMVDVLHAVIRNTPQRPFTIGVFGAWGSGKTTLMKLIKARLDADRVKTVWFNAWKYDGKEVIWNALIQQILFTMKADPDVQNSTDPATFKDQVARVASGLARYAAKVATRFVPGGIIKEEDVDKVLEALGPPSANDKLFEFVNRFEEAFDHLVKQYVGEGYLVIFIDDLDRCVPENAINVMEALKLYLDRANCIFVIGAESSIIEEGINRRYGVNSRLSGKDYLEKIIQLPFMVPRIERQNALSLLEGQERTRKYKDDPAMQSLIVEGTDCNPRRLKRLINALWVLSAGEGDLTIEQWRFAAKVLVIKMRFPKLYYGLLEEPDLADRLTDALTLKQSERAQRANSFSGLIKELYGDPELGAFLEKTHEIPCPAQEIKPWLELTKGQVAAAVQR